MTKFWNAFDRLFEEFDALFKKIEKEGMSVESNNVSIQVKDLDVTINGKIGVLRINGYRIRLPDRVISGKKS